MSNKTTFEKELEGKEVTKIDNFKVPIVVFHRDTILSAKNKAKKEILEGMNNMNMKGVTSDNIKFVVKIVNKVKKIIEEKL